MFTDCFENLEIAHTAPALEAAGQSPFSHQSMRRSRSSKLDG